MCAIRYSTMAGLSALMLHVLPRFPYGSTSVAPKLSSLYKVNIFSAKRIGQNAATWIFQIQPPETPKSSPV